MFVVELFKEDEDELIDDGDQDEQDEIGDKNVSR
jgi:hypothetical protein